MFSLSNVAIIFSVKSIALAVFEVPTGAISDLFGRKNTLIVSQIMNFFSIVLLYIGGSMTLFVGYAIFKAFARSLASGTDKALIHDTLARENKTHIYKKIIGSYESTWTFGAAIGSVIGGLLAGVSLSFPVLITLIPLGLAAILVLFIEDVDYEKAGHRNVLKHMKDSVKLVVHNKQLSILMLGGMILIGFGGSIHHFSPIFIEFKEIPIEVFGIIGAGIYGFASLGYFLSHFISEKYGDKFTIVLSVFMAPLFYLISTLTGMYVSMTFFVLAAIFFGLRSPVIDHFLNKEVESKERATVFSLANLSEQAGFSVIALALGYLADLYTINTLFIICAGFMLLVPVLFLGLKDSKKPIDE